MLNPGRLTSRLLLKMQNLLAKEGAPINQERPGNMTPETATAYLLTILIPTHREKLGVRLLREMRTIAGAVDEDSPRQAGSSGGHFVPAAEGFGAPAGGQQLAEGPISGADSSRRSRVVREERTGHGSSRADAGCEDEGLDTRRLEQRRPEGGRRRKRKRKRKERKEGSEEQRKHLGGEPRGEASGCLVEPPTPESLEDSIPDVGPSEDENDPSAKLAPRVSAQDGVLGTTGWQQKMEMMLKGRPRLDDLGRVLVEQLVKLDTPLGQFTREFGHPMRPPPTTEVPYDRRGDLLPIHPSVIREGHCGVTSRNVWWVSLTLMVVNFHYCTGWSKPCCVPMDLKLSPNQKKAIAAIAEVVDRNLATEDELPTLAEAKNLLASKRYDYCGNPVEHMMDLEADKVIPTWPKIGEAAKCCITDFLSGEALEAMRTPEKFLLPEDKMPLNSKRSKVRASDEEWLKICRAAAQRGMMTTVDDSKIPRDRSGHLVVNGAGGVRKVKEVDGKTVELLGFISILVPTNEVTMQLPGAQDSLPYVGQLTALLLDKDELAFVESEDFTSAFNLFYVPDEWAPFFAYSKKVSGAAFGMDAAMMVRPTLRVVPMGWHSAVTLVQMAVRSIVFDRVGVDMASSVEKEKPLPRGPVMTVVYLDNFDEIHKLKMVDEELSSAGPSETHVRFNEVCDELGLPRNGAKQLIHAFSGAIQGGELDGRSGVLRLAPDKLRNFIAISLGLVCQRQVQEFQIRHWVGKAAFAATFRRPLFSILEKVFDLIQRCTSSPQSMTAAED